MSNKHTYGLDEWQGAQLDGMTVAQLHAEYAATTVDDYREKIAARMKRRGIPIPDLPKPKRKPRAKK